jgi:hypothetical protein
MEFDETDQTNIAGLFNIQGTDCTTGRVFLDSTTNDNQWDIYVSGTYDIDYADVEDSKAVTTALVANNWDPIEQKHRARKRNWDLGIQKIAFLGSVNDTGVAGLLNNSTVNVNTSVITANINTLSASQFAAFVQTILTTYFANTNSTTLPTHFIMPI